MIDNMPTEKSSLQRPNNIIKRISDHHLKLNQNGANQHYNKIRQMINPTKKEISREDIEKQFRFSLKGTSSLYYKGSITVDFSPVKALNFGTSSQMLLNYSIIPRFNFDKKYYSQSFQIELDDCESDSKMKSEHKTKIKQISAEIMSNNILLPKPRGINRICAVCRTTYEDYLQHISSGFHQKLIQKSRFDKYINDLIEIIRQRQKEIKKKIINKKRR